MKRTLLMFVLIGIASAWTTARGDEGMWLFTQPPLQQLKEKYAFEPSPALLDRLQRGAVMVGRNGSGAFVSADGLVLTNHHVAMRSLQELSNVGADLLANGFVALKREEELRCPDIELRTLCSTEDVTERVLQAIKPGMSLAEAAKAREATLRAIEDESWRKTKLRSEVVTLYHGARYHLDRYKEYTDVRLVFAPESTVTQFFDVCLLRAYENGKPAKIAHHLPWGSTSAEPDDLILIAGYPGSSDRFRTSAHLEHLYGPLNFLNVKALSRQYHVVSEFAKKHPDKKPFLRHELQRLENASYMVMGELDAQEKYLAKQRTREEFELAALTVKDPEAGKRRREALERIARCLKENASVMQAHGFLESEGAFHTSLFDYARRLVRWADESVKPAGERLAGYREADEASVKRAILRPRTIIKELETLRLADSLDLFMRYAGADAGLAAQILDGKSPTERARTLIEGTQLDQLEVRKALLDGGPKAIRESKDTMIALARLIDPHARRTDRQCIEKLEEACDQAYAVLAQNQLDAPAYPDATHTLRLSFGKVLAADEVKRLMGGRSKMLSFAELFRFLKQTSQEHLLPETWQATWNKLCESRTPLVVVSNADGSPGSSGSPLVDRDGRVVAVAAWGMNLNDFAYVEDESGCAGVSTNAIIEVLEKVYRASALVRELTGNKTVAKGQTKPSAAPTLPPPPPLTLPSVGMPPVDFRPPTAGPSNLSGSAPLPSPATPALGDVKPADYLPSIPSISLATSQEDTSLAKRHKELVPALMKALKEDDIEIYRDAAAALTSLGKDAVPHLVDALKGQDKWMRAQAALILGGMGRTAESAIPALVQALEDDEPQVRRNATHALSRIVKTPTSSKE